MTDGGIRPDPLLKRLLDVVLASAAIVVTSPLWPLIAIAVKAQDRGPVFYEQQRWGRGGQRFVVKKFRTMSVSTDAVVVQAVGADARVTPVGRFLRRTGMDELPQLLSIVRGDMSLVGPRPLAVGEVVRDETGHEIPYEQVPGFTERLVVRPGLTGSTTIDLSRDASPAQKFASDLRYIEQRTLIGDIKLILRSVLNSVRGGWDSR